MNNLNAICDTIQDDLEARNTARDKAIVLSRELIRHCSESIRAIHRRDWDTADAKLEDVKQGRDEIKAVVDGFPDLYHTGYTQDALKEVAEAFITYSIIRSQPAADASLTNKNNSNYRSRSQRAFQNSNATDCGGGVKPTCR